MKWYFIVLIVFSYFTMAGVVCGLARRFNKLDELEAMLLSLVWPLTFAIPLMKIISEFILNFKKHELH